MNTEGKSSTFLPSAFSQATSAFVSSISTAGPSSTTESSFTTSTRTTFTSSPTITNAGHLTSLRSHPTPPLQASTAPFGFTVSTSFVTPTESVILQSASANSSHQGLKTIQVIAIVTSASVFLLALLAVASYLFIRRRRQRRFPPSKGPKLDDEIIEKYGTEAQYTAYLGYQQGTAESRGTTPLIDTHIDRSPIHSPSDIEHGRFDIPSSPFVNGDDASRIPIRHAISLANATPLAQPLESPLDSATFIPNSAPSSARMKSPVPLAPIAIPEYAPPTRRNTKGRRSARRSKGPYMSLETGEESDGDSASMYSQASASAATIQSVSTHLELSDSTIRTFPLTAIRLLPSHDPHAITAQRDETIVSKPMAPGAAIFTPASHPAINASADQTQEEEEDAEAARVAQENAVLVANLLKSRAMQVKQPERSSSIVSHIERAGSIKPAFLAIEEGGSSTRPSRRGVLAARKSRSGSPAQAVHASQDGVNGA